MTFHIEFEQEQDGRWIAEVVDIPGVLVYGNTREDALLKAQSLALRVLAERIEVGEVLHCSSQAANELRERLVLPDKVPQPAKFSARIYPVFLCI